MARIRNIKPDFCTDTHLSEVSIIARYLYLNLFCHMDMNGLTLDDPKLIKRDIFPYDDDMTIQRVKTLLDDLVRVTRLFRVEFEGVKYLYCPKLKIHQKFHYKEFPKYFVPLDILDEAEKYTPVEPGADPGLTLVQPENPVSSVYGKSLHSFPLGFQDAGASASASLPSDFVPLPLPPIPELPASNILCPSVTKKKSSAIRQTYSKEFDEIWALYLRKGDKKAAYEEFRALSLSDDELETLRMAVKNKVASTEYRFLKDFERFLKTDWRENATSLPIPLHKPLTKSEQIQAKNKVVFDELMAEILEEEKQKALKQGVSV